MMDLCKKVTFSALLVTAVTACGGGGGGGDTSAPTVSSRSQVNAARDKVTAVFSEPMDGVTINPSTFKLEDNIGTPVTGSVSYSGVTAIFTPTTQLANSSIYTATITTGAQDLTGNGVAADTSWVITTASGNIRISWNGNSETAVNRAGGGYKVYYSASSEFNLDDGDVTEIGVPWISGTTAPTSVVTPLNPGVYYIRVSAYSVLNPPGSSSGSTSTASPQITLNAP